MAGEPVTVNTGLVIPNTGDLVNTWGSAALNPDFVALDGFQGGVTTIAVSNAPITLSVPAGFVATPSAGPTQAQNAVLRFIGTVTTNLSVTLPMPGYYILDTTAIGFASTGLIVVRGVTGTEFVTLPIGHVMHVYNDGAIVRFVNLIAPGLYQDYAGSSVPSWISNCSKPPFLLCDGSTFSSVTYPILNGILGGNTLPDFRGRGGFFYNGGTGRLTTAGAGIDGNTLFASGGNNGVTLAVNQIPSGVPSSNASQAISVASTFSDILRLSPSTFGGSFNQTGGFGFGFLASAPSQINVASAGTNNISVTSTNSAQVVVPSTTQGTVGGIRMIRAA
jgi:hypothetical protein